MNFKEFTDRIVLLLQEGLGDNYKVTLTKVLKNNDIRLTGVVIMEESDSMSPTIYLEEPYRRYQDGVSVQEILEEIRALYKAHAFNSKFDMDFFRDFSLVESRICHKVISYEKNQELLKDVPWFKWHDLAITFYYAMEDPAIGRASVMIHNNHLDMWGKPSEEIYRIADRNMRFRMPDLLLPMHMLLEEMLGTKTEGEELSLYVLTNRNKIYGASAMLYSEKMKLLANRLHSDLLILPSSVHEVLLMPDEGRQEYDFYRQMVKEVNITQVDPEEILSFSLYRYDREKAEIEEIL
ncbi:MAG: hypothetical protein K2P48_07510 [Lachnospiraceae bacterium]|nr:hypothetical protein [Lachnospiraceae bacterium]